MDAQAVLSVLFRSLVPGAQPGLPVGGRRQHRRPEAGPQRRPQNQGKHSHGTDLLRTHLWGSYELNAKVELCVMIVLFHKLFFAFVM